MDLGFKLQYVYCWMCFVREYSKSLYITDNVILENLNTISYADTGESLYFSSELDVITTLLSDEKIWRDVVSLELDMSLDEYEALDFEFSETINEV